MCLERMARAAIPSMRWTPILGRADEVEFWGCKAPFSEQGDRREMTSFRSGL